MGDDANPESSKQHEKNKTIADHVTDFIQHIDSLAEALPMLTQTCSASMIAAAGDFQKFVQRHGKKADDGTITVTISPDNYLTFQRVRSRFERCLIADKVIRRSFVVSLVSQYDSFLGRLVRTLFYIKPELLSASERSLTLKDLVVFKSLDEAREFIVEKEVEDLIRRSHADQFDYMERKFAVKLREGLSCWPIFIEATERRNLFVHSDGIVSSQYLKVCSEHGAKLDSGATLGVALDVEPEYFTSAYACIFELGVKLAHVLWRKLHPETRELADTSLNEICYRLIREEKYGLARNLLEFAAETLKHYSSDENRRIFVINRAQVYKWTGHTEKMCELLDSEDWTACSDRFKLVLAVLHDDFGQAAEIMKKLGRAGPMQQPHYKDWPILKEFRRSPDFQSAFQETFGEPFRLLETDVTSEVQDAERVGAPPDTAQ